MPKYFCVQESICVGNQSEFVYKCLAFLHRKTRRRIGMSSEFKTGGVVGFLVREYAPNGSRSSSTASYQPDDFLLALTSKNLQIFARKTRNLGCTCLNASTDQLLASGFHCPHLHGGTDYWPTPLTFEIASIKQVLVTYRTVSTPATLPALSDNPTRPSSVDITTEQSSSVAARTRDCFLVHSTKAMQGNLHLEFEHNLARGAFVDAITAMTEGAVDIDYIDASGDHGEIGGSKFDSIEAAEAISGTELNANVFQTRRAALRSVAAGKITLALQITSEGERVGVANAVYGDPNVHFLLGTAMTMAQALDEPDLLALSWLASGFINFQRANRAKAGADARSSAVLALVQLQYVIKVARENSLPLILSFSLQCLADLVASKHIDQDTSLPELGSQLNDHKARLEMVKMWLTEAALLLPKAADTSLKMQLHRKIAESAALNTRPSGDKVSDGRARISSEKAFAAHALNLWEILLDPAGMRVATCPNGPRSSFKSLHPLAWLLLPPPKAASQQYKPSFCCVWLAGPSCSGNEQCLRVFFTPDCDVAWLKNELAQRLQACPLPTHHLESNDSIKSVQDVFDSSTGGRRSTKSLSSTVKLSSIVLSDGHSLTAIVVAIRESLPEQRDQPDCPTVLCSQCNTRVPLESVESHSETCC